MALTEVRVRAHVIHRSLFEPAALAAAVARLGFVQADPIRAPAPAQDLVLRHRVAGYRAVRHAPPLAPHRLELDQERGALDDGGGREPLQPARQQPCDVALGAPRDECLAGGGRVQVLPGTQTGAGSRVRIRGTSSISLSNNPIYVIDGIRMERALPAPPRSGLAARCRAGWAT